MYQAKSGVKNFSLTWGRGGGSLNKKIFPQSEHVSSQIWCQKFFHLLRLGTPPPENLKSFLFRGSLPHPSDVGGNYGNVCNI